MLQLLLLFGGTPTMEAQTFDWHLKAGPLSIETTGQLLRYYRIVRADSQAARYLAQTSSIGNSERSAIRLRSRATVNDPDGELLLLEFGQLQLYSTHEIRKAVGQDLYRRLLESRRDPATGERVQNLGDGFGHRDWIGDYAILLSPFERIDIQLSKSDRLFLQLGAPESHRHFWLDGTMRVGYSHPFGEAALLLPFAPGATGLGVMPPRRLSPGFGGAISLNHGRLEANARIGFPTGATPASTRSIDTAWSPTGSFSAALHVGSIRTDAGRFDVRIGGSFEEFGSWVNQDDGTLLRTTRLSRLWPTLRLDWTSIDGTIRFRTESYDGTLSGALALRLSSSVWLEGRLFERGLMRERAEFEDSIGLFLTPTFKF